MGVVYLNLLNYLNFFNFMAVQYVLAERGNPLKPEDPKKWYANTKSTGEVS
jgi:hypothetical protein